MSIVLEFAMAIILATSNGEKWELDQLADRLAQADVVVLGEEHDNRSGHDMQMRILEALSERRSDIVLAMEMFERDKQSVVNDYLSSKIDEETFLEHSRPWRTYKRFYRPMVEHAKERGFDVLAANAPTKEMRQISRKGMDTLERSHWHALRTSAPRDRYWDLFQEAMDGHGGADAEAAIYRLYQAQCMKDDTMAESITSYLNQRPFRQPLVVLLCGKFHSDYGEGTVRRILERRPLTRVEVCTMVSSEEPADVKATEFRDRAHFVLAVSAEPKKKPAVKTTDSEKAPEPAVASFVKANEKATTQPTKKKEGAVPSTQPTSRPVEVVEVVEVDTDARPALGFMPSYEAEGTGVLVQAVTEGGPGDRAGMEDGDRIVKIGKEKIADIGDYMDVMDELRPGQKVTVTVKRGDLEKQLEVTLGSR